MLWNPSHPDAEFIVSLSTLLTPLIGNASQLAQAFGTVSAVRLGGVALGQESTNRVVVEALFSGMQTWTELGLLGLLPYAKCLLARSLATTASRSRTRVL